MTVAPGHTCRDFSWQQGDRGFTIRAVGTGVLLELARGWLMISGQSVAAKHVARVPVFDIGHHNEPYRGVEIELVDGTWIPIAVEQIYDFRVTSTATTPTAICKAYASSVALSRSHSVLRRCAAAVVTSGWCVGAGIANGIAARGRAGDPAIAFGSARETVRTVRRAFDRAVAKRRTVRAARQHDDEREPH